MTSVSSRQTGFPLVALFLLIGVVASVAGQFALLRDADVSVAELTRAAAVFSVGGATLGIIVGLHHLRRIRGGIVGMLVGLCVGAFAGPIGCIADREPVQSFAAAAVCGATMIVCAATYHLFNVRNLTVTTAATTSHALDRTDDEDNSRA